MTPPHPDRTAGPPDATERLELLWREGGRPDVDAFLAQAGPLPPGRVAAVLRVDQRERWRAGERVPAEEYFRRRPDLRADADAALDLICSEFILREGMGERPALGEYLQRFPDYAAPLREQLEFHQALGADALAATASAAGPGGDTPPVAPPPGPTLPEAFGRYRILKELGRGGMGTVYLARDERLGRTVALKAPHFAGRDPAQVARFYREARIAAAFTHPNLCPVYDVGEVNGVHYLTMPYLEGESLAGRLRRAGPPPPREAARLAADVARALQAAHEAGVLHRDLKPANVMLTAAGPVVMDFGLARRAAAGDARLTSTGVVLGTPAYLAPERIGGDPDEMGTACDVYSLGVMLYELLTGRLPFVGTVREVLRQALGEEPAPPSRLRRGLGPRLDAVCRKALAKDPAARFASMAAFAEALESYLRDEKSTVISAPLGGRRRRTMWLAAAGAAVVLVGAGVTAFVAFRPTPAPPAAPPPPADPFRVGAHWEGTYKFDPPQDDAGDVRLDVEERDGDSFRGVYATQGGRWVWLVEGTAHGSVVSWKFVGKRHETDPGNVVGNAYVVGRYDGEAMTATYHEPAEGGPEETAPMRLRLRK